MHETSDVLKRSKFSNILSYLIYITGENQAMVESCDSAIDESYETFFDNIESMYSNADRQDNNLFRYYIKVCLRPWRYLFWSRNAGGVSTIQRIDWKLWTPWRQRHYCHFGKEKQSLDTDHEASSALDSFCMHRLNTALEESIQKDKSYQKKDEEIH